MAMNVNNVTLVGRLANDPELKFTPSGVPVTTFRVAVSRPWKNSEGKYDADFFDVVAWRQQAEFAANYGTKGAEVSVVGRLQARTYTTQEGQNRRVVEIVADSVSFGAKPQGQNGNGQAAPPADAYDSDVPEDALAGAVE